VRQPTRTPLRLPALTGGSDGPGSPRGGLRGGSVCLEGRGSGENANSDWEETSEWAYEEGGEKASSLIMPVGKG
jgi:hypothetical protein